VRKKHKELDRLEIHAQRKDLTLGIGRMLWASHKKHTTSGLWIGGIRIENLTSEDKYAPRAMVRINYPTQSIDMPMSERTLRAAAEDILATEDFSQLDSEVNLKNAEISYPLREPRDKRLDFLLKGDEIAFIDCLAAHFEAMVGFIPVLDEIFQVGKNKDK
jgi:hypothetical protein